jgi:hypothetical protein
MLKPITATLRAVRRRLAFLNMRESSASPTARQRCTPLLTLYGLKRGTAEAMLPILATSWVDGAVMLAVFERERPRT